jgi:hypothetical protein
MKKHKSNPHNISRDQFHALIKKAAQPVQKSTVSDSEHSQTSAEGHSGGCNETHTHSDKIGDI